MNVKQLERIRKMIGSIRAELETDITGTSDITEAINELTHVVTEELRNEVWKEYSDSQKVEE